MKQLLLLLWLICCVVGQCQAQQPVSKAVRQPILTAPLATLTALQGKWQSVDDPREWWVVQGTSLTMRYVTSGTSTDDELLTVQVTDTCVATCAATAAHTVPRGQYLSVVDMECSAPRCYNVVSCSPTLLTVSYTARGNTLRLRRVTPVPVVEARLPGKHKRAG